MQYNKNSKIGTIIKKPSPQGRVLPRGPFLKKQYKNKERLMKYSGRTTDHKHKFDDWEKKGLNIGKDCIQKLCLFDVQWSNCPVEVEEEVKKLWKSMDFSNDYYYEWDEDNDTCEAEEVPVKGCNCTCCNYPLITTYLRSRGITKCLIHWWW